MTIELVFHWHSKVTERFLSIVVEDILIIRKGRFIMKKFLICVIKGFTKSKRMLLMENECFLERDFSGALHKFPLGLKLLPSVSVRGCCRGLISS